MINYEKKLDGTVEKPSAEQQFHKSDAISYVV